jgi:hypothetical protein
MGSTPGKGTPARLKAELLDEVGEAATPSGKTFILATLDSAGRILGSRSFDATPPQDDDDVAAPFTIFIPFDPTAEALSLSAFGKELARIKAGAAPPTISLRAGAPAAGEVVSGQRSIAWNTTAQGVDSVMSLWRSSDGGESWVPLSVNCNRLSATADFDLLPSSTKTLLRVTPTSGLRAASATSPAFVVNPRDPVLTISSPAPKSSVTAGIPVVLEARLSMSAGPDWSPVAPAPIWSSDREGGLGSGFRRSARLLISGTHVITAEANVNGGGAVAKASTTVNVSRGVEGFVQAASGKGGSASLSLLNIPRSSVVHVTAVSNPSPGAHPAGVMWDGKGWAIFNNDKADIADGATYLICVRAPSAAAFVYRASLTDTSSNSCILKHPLLDGRPEVRPILTSVWNPNGATGVNNPHPIGAWWTGSHWAVYNEDRAPMPAGAAFHIEVARDGGDVFLHRATLTSIAGNTSRLSHPRLDKNPHAIFHCTHIWNPDGALGVYNPHCTAVRWDGAGWSIVNLDLAPMPEGASFVIAIAK